MNQKSLDKKKTIYVSKCCNSEMTVVGDSFGEGTNHYECNECHQPCDFIQLKSSQSLDKQKPKELEWINNSLHPSREKIMYLVDNCVHDLLELSTYLTEVMYGNITINANGGKFVWIPDKGDKYLAQQRTELLEEILKIIDNCPSNKDGASFIHNSIINLLNKKDDR